MTQSIIIQVGQCGNQIGYRFWDLALQEKKYSGFVTTASDEFFRPVEKITETRLCALRARALLVDMEEGVVSEILKSHIRDLFNSTQLVTDVSGSGNNWAVGHNVYGTLYMDKIEDLLRREAEMCDNLQCFFIIHSMGGGTGSGLGTAILETLCDIFNNKYRFVTCVYPSTCDDVITSPYNTILANNQLIEYAHCVIPVENEALNNMCNHIQRSNLTLKNGIPLKGISANSNMPSAAKYKPFDQMNNIVANLLINLTCSSRFPGELNMDLNEIIINMMPYPRLHFLVSSMTPLYPTQDIRMNQVVTDLFSCNHQLIKGDFRSETFLSCAIMARGAIPFSDVQKNIEKVRSGLKLAPWGEDVWKISLCNIPPLNHSYSLSMIANNTLIWQRFMSMKQHFMKMYSKKAHLHHFLNVDGVSGGTFDLSIENLDTLIEEYKALGDRQYHNMNSPRIQVLV